MRTLMFCCKNSKQPIKNNVQEPNGTVPQKAWPAVLWLYWYLVVLLNPTKSVLETQFDRCSEAPLFQSIKIIIFILNTFHLVFLVFTCNIVHCEFTPQSVDFVSIERRLKIGIRTKVSTPSCSAASKLSENTLCCSFQQV